MLEDFFDRIAHMPDVARANVYSRDRTIIWSNNKAWIVPSRDRKKLF